MTEDIFSPDELSHIAIVEDSLFAICEKKRLGLSYGEPTAVRGMRSWQRQTSIPFRGNKGNLHFEIKKSMHHHTLKSVV